MKKTLLLLIFGFFISTMFSQSIDATEIELNFNGDSYPQNFTKGITKMYFSADDGVNMEELWVYDSVTDKAHLVKDVANGNSGLYKSKMMTIGDILYFTVNTGSQLWRSDGTEAGTYLLKIISTFPASNNTIQALFNYNGNIVFDAYDPINGKELWISDGTVIGTTLLKDIRVGDIGSNPTSFFICNGVLYFVANDGINGNEIWKSDGTTNGTVIFKDIDGTSNSSISSQFIVLNNNFYFYCYSSTHGNELWKSDGTDSGTQLFKDIVPGIESSNYYLDGIVTPNYFIFEVRSATIGRELWVCDGTVNGTTLLKDINPGTGNGISDTTEFVLLNDKLYFNASNTIYGEELWTTDGTTDGTQLIKDITPGSASSYITKLTAANNYLIFSAKNGVHNYKTPWVSDGTDGGTFELKDTNLSVTSAGNLNFHEINNKVFFGAGYNSSNGNELWSTDGTTANTKLFKDIYHKYGGVTDFYDSAILGNKIIFTGNNGNGNEPFVSEGSIDGSLIIKDISPGGASPFFSSDGFRPAAYTKSGSFVYFRAVFAGSGYEIWKTDGTEANTSIVKDIRPGSASSITEFPLFIDYNEVFYFKANDGEHGEELWRSDGTETGTYMLKDINPGSESGVIQSNIYFNHYNIVNHNCYAILNGLLYFTAYDGLDRSIWRTDGTNNGTIKVITLPPSGLYDTDPTLINVANNKIFFKTNSDNSTYGNNTLWSSDGTQSGTINLGAWYNTAVQFKKNIVHNNELYFTVNSNNGSITLMKSDGSINGTTIVKENFTAQVTFNSLYSCGNSVYFTVGQVGYAGKELWKSDGTTLGTIKLEDLTNSNSQNFFDCTTCYENNLIFRKDFFDNKLWYVNDSMNEPSFYNVNLINSDNFSEYEGISGLAEDTSNGLFFSGVKRYGGTELYHIDLQSQLGINNFSPNIEALAVIKVFPNPTSGKISIKTLDQSTIVKIDLFDILGKKIKSTTETNNIDLSEISNGLYLLKVTTDKSVQTKKIIIKHN